MSYVGFNISNYFVEQSRLYSDNKPADIDWSEALINYNKNMFAKTLYQEI